MPPPGSIAQHGCAAVLDLRVEVAIAFWTGPADCDAGIENEQTRIAMHPRIAELIAYIDAETAMLKQAYEAVPPERRAERPAPDRWSPAEVVHHLAIVERRLALRMAAFVEELRVRPPETDASPVLPTINSTRAIDRSRRFVTSEAAAPQTNDAERAWSDLEDARRELTGAILSGDGLAFGTVSAPHPALGNLSGYEWIAFAGAHAARHADQIREMRSA